MEYAIPSNILRKITQNAPSCTASEDDGRQGGYYGGGDESASGYKRVT